MTTATAYPGTLTARTQARLRRRSRWGVALAVAVSLLTTALLLMFPPGWLAVVCCGAVAFVLVSWYRPVWSLSSLLGLTLLFEQFDFALFRPWTRSVPFFENASRITGVGGLEASPLELLLVTWSGVILLRILMRRATYRPNPLGGPVLTFLVAAALWLAYGLVSGGALNTGLWELRGLAYFGLLVLAAPQAFESRADVRTVLWVAGAFVVFKAAQGLYNYAVVLGGDLTNVRSVTAHEDALFIAWLLVFLAALWLYRTGAGQRWFLTTLSPVLLAAFLVTDRRAAIVALALGLMLLASIVATDASKRALLVRIAVPAVLLAVALVAAGWNSAGVLGIPADIVRSIGAPDNEVDRASSYYRRAEEVNLIKAIEPEPVFGLGFGRPYQAPGQGGIVEIDFSLKDVIPHNAVFWVWAKMGTVGFAVFWAMIGGCIAFGIVAFKTLREPYLRAIAVLVTCAVAMQMVVSYVDLQLTYARNMVFLGILVGVLSQLPALEAGERVGDA